jgi:hypothetical protein
MPDKAMLVMDAMMYLGGLGLVQVYASLAVGQVFAQCCSSGAGLRLYGPEKKEKIPRRVHDDDGQQACGPDVDDAEEHTKGKMMHDRTSQNGSTVDRGEGE